MSEEQLGLAIERALEEDVGQGDVTSMWTLPPNAIARTRIVAKKAGILAGLVPAERVFNRVNALIAFSPLTSDGQKIHTGDNLVTVVGPATSVFTAERTALNFLGRMSGIATLTRRYVEAVSGTNAVIVGTRQTVPGLRQLDQWAVRLGGGGNHRARLDEAVLIRNGHITIAGGIAAAVESVRHYNTGLQAAIEVQTWEQLDEALPLDLDRIVLVGFSVQDTADAVRWVAGRVPLEVSGEITLDNVRAVAETGIDYISVGALTQEARALAVSLIVDVS
jgi:nicotinate-nucleotide pyrophosphorylase (carboxylating)